MSENKHNTKQEDEKKSHDDSKPKFNSKELLEVNISLGHLLYNEALCYIMRLSVI